MFINDSSQASQESELVKLQKWVPPSQDKPRERPLVRKVLRKMCDHLVTKKMSPN